MYTIQYNSQLAALTTLNRNPSTRENTIEIELIESAFRH